MRVIQDSDEHEVREDERMVRGVSPGWWRRRVRVSARLGAKVWIDALVGGSRSHRGCEGRVLGVRCLHEED